jgi:hypothetical protein
MRYLIYFLVLATVQLLTVGSYLLAADESTSFPDPAGREALRLWAEREYDRAVAEAVRNYWDYRLSKPCHGYSPRRLWFELAQTQRWLKDPKHNDPPPPPPVSHWWPPYYPFYPCCCDPHPWTPHLFYPPPYYYPYPQGQNRHRERDIK